MAPTRSRSGSPTSSPPRSSSRGDDASTIRRVAQNRRARYDYDILETFECGIELRGAEVKSLRANQVSLQDAYARIEDGELWLLGTRIAPYEYSSGFGAVDPNRRRKLLLHRRQIDELFAQITQQPLTLVPLSICPRARKAKVDCAVPGIYTRPAALLREPRP